MSDDAATWIIRHGRPEPAPERIALRAGPLELTYEAGEPRWIRLGGVEVVRRVYPAVRDRAWKTCALRILSEEREIGQRSFSIAHDAEHVGTDADGVAIAVAARVELTGGEDGVLTMTWEAESRSDFQSNRLGLCLLHPAALAGARLQIEQVDGSRISGTFPQRISPHQPFVDLRAVTARPLPGVELEARLSGDIFEMEDQRNWGDGSFKTYSRPLAYPYPFPVRAGERFRQQIVLTPRGAPAIESSSRASGTILLRSDPDSPRPAIGIALAGGEPPAVSARLRALAPDHVRVDVDLAAAGWRQRLLAAVEAVRGLGCAIELALLGAEDERGLASLAEAARAAPIATVLVLARGARPTPPDLVARSRQALAPALPDARFGGGASGPFTELNRFRPRTERWDVLAFATHPQVHAADASSIVENLEAFPALVRSAEALRGPAALAISPLTFAERGGGDARQGSLLAAAWLVGALPRLAGLASITACAAHGADGILDDDGAPRPLWQVLADIWELREARMRAVDVGDPLTRAALALETDTRRRLLVANLAPTPATIVVGVPAAPRLRVLDERSASAARSDPEAWRAAWSDGRREGGGLRLDLLPYAVATIDC